MPDIDERYYRQIDMKVPPTKDTHVATKKYLHDFVAGKIKNNVRAVISDALTDFIYDQSTQTLTDSTKVDLIAYDNVSLSVGDRVLITNRTVSRENGIYVVTTVGSVGTTSSVFTRADDFNEDADIVSNVRIPVTEGLTNADSIWVLTTDGVIVLDITGLIFTKLAPSAPVVVTQANAKIAAFTFTTDGSSDSWEINHNLDTELVIVQIYDATKAVVEFAVKIKNTNTVTISSGYSLPGGDTFTVIVIGYTT